MLGVCKKTTGSTGGRWVGQWWVGRKVGSPAFLCPNRSRSPANIAAYNFLTRNRLIPISTQVNFNRVGLYRLNSVRRNHRPHRPNRVIPTSHWLPVWPKGVIAGVSLISVVTQLNFNRVGLYENKRRCRLGYHHCHVPLSSHDVLDSHNNLFSVFIFIACHHTYARY